MSFAALRTLALSALTACIALAPGCATEGDEPVVEEATSELTSPLITVYEHANFQGRFQSLPNGNFSGSALAFPGQISSVRVPLGMSVKLCSPNGGGCPDFLGEDTPQVSCNDCSVEVIVRPAVVLYEHANYQGKHQTIVPAGQATLRANLGNLSVVGNDAISSISIPPYHWVFLCKNEGDPENQCLKLYASSPYIGNAFNDQVSKVIDNGFLATVDPTPNRRSAGKSRRQGAPTASG